MIPLPRLLAALLALGFVAGVASAQGLERELTIRMGEMYFQIDGQAENEAIELETGVPYRVTFINEGDVVHRVKFGRGVTAEEGVPYDYVENLFDGVFTRAEGVAEGNQFAVDTERLLELDVEPGAEVVFTFTLPSSTAGEWEIGCFVPSTQDTPNHYTAGMRAPLIVQ